MKHARLTILLCLLALFLSSCFQNLQSESGLYNVELKHTYKAAVDGAWVYEGVNRHARNKNGTIYIAPLDISKVIKDQPKLAPLLVTQMHDYMLEEMKESLAEMNKKNKVNWTLTNNPNQASIRIDIAVVKFKSQHFIARTIANIGGWFMPVPGVSTVAEHLASGSICIEATIKDVKTGQLYLAFKDSNRKQTRLYEAEAYSKTGEADKNLKAWAKRLGKVIRTADYDETGHSRRKDNVLHRNFSDVVADHLL